MNSGPRARVGALDLLRGITVAAMIVVNNPGNWNTAFPQLVHAAWNGVTVADLIFPAFIFIMGVAMSLALASRVAASGRAGVYRRVASRAMLLVLLGLVLNAAAEWPALSSLRLPGVLQRIGVTYLIAAIVTVSATAAWEWVVASGLLLAHWALLVLPSGLPMSGLLEPGRNVGVVLDRALFGSHLLTPAGDPEGALGLVSCVATALVGAAVGRWLRREVETGGTRNLLLRLLMVGASGIALGYVWSFVLPLNKALWTGSFAVLACGVAMVSLVAVTAIDGPRTRRVATPFFWLGTNPLAIYFLSELLTDLVQRPWLRIGGHILAPKEWIYWSLLVPAVGDHGGPWSSLTYAVLYTLFWIGVAGVMQWRGVRLRV